MNARFSRLVRRPVLLGVILASLVAGGVYALRPQHASGEAPAAPSAVPVTVETLVPEKVRVWSAFSGRLHPVEAAEIRPEVGGRIMEVRFEDGRAVNEGDVLFVIDPRPYEAAVARARANLAEARANAAFAKRELERAASLIGTQAIPERLHNERANASRVADAAVQAAEAELKQAELDLEHAYVRAPISGRAGRVEVTVGNLVQPGASAPLLTTIVSNEAVYADFEVDEQTYIESIRDHATGRDAERRIPVELSVGEGGDHVYRGHIYSFDNHIDVASGTIRARARFDNEDGTLLPGMFVTVRLAEAVERSALLIPERAVGFDQSRQFVYIVDADGEVAYREVELGREVKSRRIALKGAEPGDRVIVDGVQHVRPDMVVEAREATSSPSAVQASAGN